MHIVQYPHPALRYRARPLKRVDAELRAMIQGMFELMYAHKGVGLAATQVALPYRVFVVNESADPRQQDQEHVFINPVLSKKGTAVEDEEGCLSLPGLYAPVVRPARASVTAYNLQGQEVRHDLEGMLARIVQHEHDHLDGILFIDKLTPANQADVRESLEEFELDFHSRRQQGQIPPDDEILRRMNALAAERC
jgi:peptide deformylase